jgi:hypothetical protein
MAIEIVKSCPLGSQCKEIKDGKMYQCMWLVTLSGQDAQGKEQDREDCAIAWQPLLALESSRHNVVNTAAINSLRNETVKRQDAAIALQAGLSRNQIKDIVHEESSPQ